MKSILVAVSLALAAISNAHAAQKQLQPPDPTSSVIWDTLDDIVTEDLQMFGPQRVVGGAGATLGSEGSFTIEFFKLAIDLFLDYRIVLQGPIADDSYHEIVDPGYLNITYFNVVGKEAVAGPFIKAVVDYQAPLYSYKVKAPDPNPDGPRDFHLEYQHGEPVIDLFYYTLATNVTVPSPIPEPETYALMLSGLSLIGLAARRRRERYEN